MSAFQSKWANFFPNTAGHDTDNTDRSPSERARKSPLPVAGKQKTLEKVKREIKLPSHPFVSVVSSLNLGNKKNTDAEISILEWDDQSKEAIAWFESSEPPAESFQLHQGVRVINPKEFWKALKSDLKAGPSQARAKYGSLQRDLQRLNLLQRKNG